MPLESKWSMYVDVNYMLMSNILLGSKLYVVTYLLI